jgi:SAM-dependent methyltransferase
VGESNSAEAEVEQIMLRIRAELGRHAPNRHELGEPSAPSAIVKQTVDSSLSTARLASPENIPLPKLTPLELDESGGSVAQSTFEPTTGRRYHIEELLEYQDRDFIHAAYWTVLEREPDDGGLNTYLRLLRGGTSKIEILEYLRDSPEGRLAKATITGLSIQIRLLKISRWPLLGAFGRIAAALWNLSEEQCRQRVVQGYLISLIEKNRAHTTEAFRLVNRALRDIESAYHHLTAYAASKLGNDESRRIEASIASINDLVNELRKLVTGKANLEDVRRALGEVSASREQLLRSLETKVERPALKALASTVDEVRGELGKLTTDRIGFAQQIAGLEEARRLLTSALETKAARPELKTLESTMRNSVDKVFGELRKLQADGGGFAQEIAIMRAEARHFVEHIEKSKLDMAGLEEARLLLTSALETKAARPELRTLESTVRNSVDEVCGELRKLKADGSGFAQQMAVMRSEGMYFSAHVEKSNAAMARLDESQQLLTRSLEAKTERAELKSLELSLQNSVDEVGGDLRNFKTEGGLLAAQIAVLGSERAHFSAHVEKSNADIARLDEAYQVLTRSMETKAERPELATLTDHILGVVRDRLTKEEFAATKASIDGAVHMISHLSETKVDRAAIETYKEETKKLLEAMRIQSGEELQAALVAVNSRTRDVKLNLIDQERRLGLLLEEARRRLPKPISANQIETMLTEEDHLLDAMYAEFEDIFRGTRADILQRQSIYIPTVREAGAGEISSPIVDIGCGRGEWLELLRDSGLRAQGVDTNRIFLQRCRDLSLDVIESDAITFLRGAKRNSFGAVTSFHLIEHLPHKTLIAMLDAALHALRPGGVIILETPNPRNLQVASCNFYLDPTHRHPLPPDLMKFVMEARGFVGVEIKELHPYSAENLATEGPATINGLLNRFLFSSQDYAVIGRKS